MNGNEIENLDVARRSVADWLMGETGLCEAGARQLAE